MLSNQSIGKVVEKKQSNIEVTKQESIHSSHYNMKGKHWHSDKVSQEKLEETSAKCDEVNAGVVA